MKKPYIGITGFMKSEEVVAVSGVMDSADRMLMVGVLASSKTLLGRQNRYPNRYPKIEEISRIFPPSPAALNLIHYNTDEPETLVDQLSRLTEYGGVNLNGFQLNIAWPFPIELFSYRLSHPGKVIVLQVGNHAFEMVDNSSQKLAQKVKDEYSDFIDYILLDPSGGRGKPLKTETARIYLQALKEKNMNIGLAIAGGLSPQTLGILEPLARDFPDLSVDAEGRLRDENDRLDIGLARQYVLKVSEIFKGQSI